MSRSSVALTGLIGLIGAGIVTALCAWIVIQDMIPVLLNRPLYVWGLLGFLLFFSLAEIPVMIFGIRHITNSVNPRAKYVALLLTASYPLFAAVYAAPFILLTGRLIPGIALAAFSFVRFITAIIFLPGSTNEVAFDSPAARW